MSSRIPSIVLTALPIAIATGLWLLGSVDAELLQRLVDSLAPDERASRFPLERIERIQVRVRIAALPWMGLGVLFALPGLRVPQRLFALGGESLATLRHARGVVRVFVRDEPREALAVAALTGLFGVLALAVIGQPMRCDEAGTYFEYIQKPWYLIVTSYQSANNHILHNLIAHWNTRLFGDGVGAIRMTALLAGVLTVPLGYAAVRIHFDKHTALLATAMIASWFWLVDLATTARGYSMLNLVFVLLLIVAARVLRGDRGAWLFFVLLCAAGVYTVPVMVYSLAIVFLWLALTGALDLPRDEALRFERRLVVAGASSVALALALYSWTFVTSGTDTVVMAKWVRPHVPPSYADLVEQLGNLLAKLWSHWMHGIPAPVRLAMLGGCAVAMVPREHEGVRGQRLLLAAVFATIATVLALGRVPFFWTTPHLALLCMIAAAAGFVIVVDLFARGRERVKRFAVGVAVVALCAMNVKIALDTRGEMDVPWYVGYHEAPEAARFLVEEGDDLLVTGVAIHLQPVRYHLARLGRDDASILFGRYNDLPDDGIRALYFIESEDEDLENIRASLEALGFTRSSVAAEFERSRVLRLQRE